MVGRIQVETDDVADLPGEEGVGGEPEVLLPLGLEVEGGPETLDRGLRDPGGGGHGPAGPVRAAVGGTGLERPLQQRHDGVVRDGARPSRAVFVVEAHEALAAEAFAPAADRLAADAEPFRHRRVVQALGAQQHDPGAAHQARGQAARPGQHLEFLARVRADFKRLQRTAPGHGLSLLGMDAENPTLSAPLCLNT